MHLPADRGRGPAQGNVKGFKLGPTFDTNFAARRHEVTDRKAPVPCRSPDGCGDRRQRRQRRPSLAWAGRCGFLVVAAITFLGLLAVTFFIGRVMPIDPVLAIVGDRAPATWSSAARKQSGFDLPL